MVTGLWPNNSAGKPSLNILKNDDEVQEWRRPRHYAEDQKYTKAAIDAMGGPVVLVGHSSWPSSPRPAIIQTLQRLSIFAAFALDEGGLCVDRAGPAAEQQEDQTGQQRALVE